MAFNPLAGFAKYKRAWMGAVMILVLITFVLCTGNRGGMDDILLKWFRFGGTPVASIDGTTYYRQEFDKIQLQRKVANEYMRTFSKLIVDLINDRLRNFDPKDNDAKAQFQQLAITRNILTERTKKAKFFDTGTKSEELVDFRTWLSEADRLNIRLTQDAVRAMVNAELYVIPQMNLEGIYRMFGDQVVANLERATYSQVVGNHGHDRINFDFILKALENEYRVRIAQLAVAEFQLRSEQSQQFMGPKRIEMRPGMKAEEVRTPMAPAFLWDFFQEQRKEFDIALLPIPIEAFVSEIAAPDQKKLDEMFEKYKKQSYDPVSDSPGFRKPHQVRIQYASADMNSPFFRGIAQAVGTLTAYPIGFYTPQMPIATAMRFATGQDVAAILLQAEYDKVSRPRYIGPSILSPDIASPIQAYLAHEQPIAIASYIGDIARPDNILAATPAYLAVGNWKNPDAVKAGIKREAARRVPYFATLIATGTMPTGLAVAGEVASLYEDRPLLPLPVVEKALSKMFEQGLAGKFVSANLALLKRELEKDTVIGKEGQIKRLLSSERYGPGKPGDPPREKPYRDLGLELAQTDKLYDRYSIKDAPELKPLLEAYLHDYENVNIFEGRESEPEKKLKEDDFWKLFFDASETFSVAQGKYQAKTWPPTIKIGSPTQLAMMQKQPIGIDPADIQEMMRRAQNKEPNKDATFSWFATANRPFLFWKTEEKPGIVPDAIADVKDQVEHAWKFQQARENKALPYAKTLAQSLLKGNADYASVLKIDEKFGGPKLISLDRLAPLAVRGHFGGYTYGPYQLPKGVLTYPREDLVSQLMALGNMKDKEPIKINVPDIDRLNADLFEEAKQKKLPGNKYVQILTNKPRDTYYVAVVQASHDPSISDFLQACLVKAPTGQDGFFDKAQEMMGDAQFKEIVRQLRKDHRVEVFAEAAKSYDTEGGS